MKLKLWQVDAFANKPLEGNPAAVIPLKTWLDAGLMQKIANENNLAETAFFVRTAPGRYELRWFTPEIEVPLCGHATLASAWTIFNVLDTALQAIAFETKSGTLNVTHGENGRITMSLPSESLVACAESGLAEAIGKALDTTPPREIFEGKNLFCVWDDAGTIRALPGPGEIARILRARHADGLIATAPGDAGYDFVSRYFAPTVGIPEDPVTGGAHCALTPFWSRRLGKKTLKARQVSPRGGDVDCTDEGARALLSGTCAHYMTGEIEVA